MIRGAVHAMRLRLAKGLRRLANAVDPGWVNGISHRVDWGGRQGGVYAVFEDEFPTLEDPPANQNVRVWSGGRP